jgi:hypothetical protein
MKAYEFPVKIIQGGIIQIPDKISDMLSANQSVRVIILAGESEDIEEKASWSRLSAEQFFDGYSQSDSVYDRI